jgi:hypothetical protein
MHSAEIRQAIENRLAEYLSRPDEVWGVADIARQYNALPVYLDMGGMLFLTPSGDVFFLGNEDGDSMQPETSIEWRTIAAVVASEKYPELAALRPQRPDSAIDCPECGGTGRVMPQRLRCGDCLSLGWKLPGQKLWLQL